jgi:hypothetical protein
MTEEQVKFSEDIIDDDDILSSQDLEFIENYELKNGLGNHQTSTVDHASTFGSTLILSQDVKKSDVQNFVKSFSLISPGDHETLNKFICNCNYSKLLKLKDKE